MSRPLLALTFAIVIAACSQTSPSDPSSSADPVSTNGAPKDEQACTADADCVASTQSPETCCSRCEARALNQAAFSALGEKCRDKAGGPPECPSLDCPNEGTVPRCVEQRCTMVET